MEVLLVSGYIQIEKLPHLNNLPSLQEMNLLLQDPFSVLRDYPDKLTQTLNNPLRATSLRFSPHGDYLATGCMDGAIIIYDMDTCRPMWLLGGSKQIGHVRAVQCVEWDAFCGGRFLLSCSEDMSLMVWDLKRLAGGNVNGALCAKVCFDAPVWGCQWLECKVSCDNNIDRVSVLCVVSLYESINAILVSIDIENGQMKTVERQLLQDDSDINTNTNTNTDNQGYVLVCTVHPKHHNIVFTGSSKGWLNVYHLNDGSKKCKQLLSTRLCSSNIKHITISSNGEKLAVNCSDRIIRQYTLRLEEDHDVELELEHKYQDVINKLQWNSIQFSNNSGDYLVAAPHGSSSRELYLWETSSATLVRVFEGAEEELFELAWDYHRMTIASTGYESGDVYLWTLVVPPKWSALAPDFEEIDENIEYLEKEDEFDVSNDDISEEDTREDISGEGATTKLETLQLDLQSRETFDVRGNDISQRQFVIPTDYQRILLLRRDGN